MVREQHKKSYTCFKLERVVFKQTFFGFRKVLTIEKMFYNLVFYYYYYDNQKDLFF